MAFIERTCNPIWKSSMRHTTRNPAVSSPDWSTSRRWARSTRGGHPCREDSPHRPESQEHRQFGDGDSPQDFLHHHDGNCVDLVTHRKSLPDAVLARPRVLLRGSGRCRKGVVRGHHQNLLRAGRREQRLLGLWVVQPPQAYVFFKKGALRRGKLCLRFRFRRNDGLFEIFFDCVHIARTSLARSMYSRAPRESGATSKITLAHCAGFTKLRVEANDCFKHPCAQLRAQQLQHFAGRLLPFCRTWWPAPCKPRVDRGTLLSRRMVSKMSRKPCRARKSVWTGMISRFEATNAFTKSTPMLGGQSKRTKSYSVAPWANRLRRITPLLSRPLSSISSSVSRTWLGQISIPSGLTTVESRHKSRSKSSARSRSYTLRFTRSRVEPQMNAGATVRVQVHYQYPSAHFGPGRPQGKAPWWFCPLPLFGWLQPGTEA